MVRATAGEPLADRQPADCRMRPSRVRIPEKNPGEISREKPFERAVLLCFGCFGHDSRARSCTRRDRSTTHRNFQRLAVAGHRQGPPDRRTNLFGVIRYARLVSGDSSGHRSNDAGEQPRLPRAALRRKQSPREYPRKPRPYVVLVSHRRHCSQGIQESPRLAQLRRHQLLCRGVGQRCTGRRHPRRLHPRQLRHHGAGETRPAGGRGCAHYATAASRRSARAHHSRRSGTERRRLRDRRTDFSLHPRLGLDPGHPRP